MRSEESLGRRSFILAAGALAGGALLGEAGAEPDEGDLRLVDDNIGLKRGDDGAWVWSHEYHRDTSAPFRAGESKVQWVYEMTAAVHLRSDSGAAPTKGAHRWFLLNFVAEPRLCIRETHPQTDGKVLMEWPMEALSAAVLVEAGAGEVVVHPPVGNSGSRRHGIGLDLKVKVEELGGHEGRFVSFWPGKPDFAGFDKDAALARLGELVGVPRGEILNQNPIGSTNNTNSLQFALAKR